MDLSLFTIPPSTPHTHTVIFLHGRGDTAKTFAASLSYSLDSQKRTLQQTFPSFRWVFPQTELRQSALNPGPKMSQWFDIWNVNDFSLREELQAVGLRESVASIKKIIAREVEILGGRWDRVVLAGISQGAATGVHTLLNLGLSGSGEKQAPPAPGPLGAFLGFSCRMPFPGRSLSETRNVLRVVEGALDGAELVHDGSTDEIPSTQNAPETDEPDEIISNTPILLSHCVDDPLVLVQSGRNLRDTLTGFGAQVTWKEYPDGGHWFNSPAGIDDAVEFLNKHVLKKE